MLQIRPRTGHEGPEGKYRYSSTVSLTSDVDGVRGRGQIPADSAPGKRINYKERIIVM
jgi:hypothetical protein